jgi:hypothetical protein
MRRLVCSAAIHLPTAGAWLPFCPRRFFGFSPSVPDRGAGALPVFRPSPSFGGDARVRMALEAGGGANASDSE